MASGTSTSSADLRCGGDSATGSLPNLVVIGAQKCGTTSLHYYLDQHPEISMARAKELDFFIPRGTWNKGIDWYAAQFDATAVVRGESSPSYTSYPMNEGVPARMQAIAPDARLIYLVRDPLDRIVSTYLHDYSAGREDHSIEDALLARRITAHPYVMRSKYYWQLEQYFPFFPRERILVLAQEDLLLDRARTLRQAFDFLGVDASFYDPKFERVKHRTSHRRRKTLAGRALSAAADNATLGFEPPRWLAWKAERLLVFPFARRIERPLLTGAIQEQLISEFREDADRLRTFTGREFASWSV